MKRVSIFADVQNIYYTSRQRFQRNFDYNAFWRVATANRDIFKAFAYAIERNDEKQRQFQNILRGIGFEVKLKQFIQRSDGSAKGDWDVGITLDVMQYAAESDVIILLTGDGDFDMLVARVKELYDVEVEVYGVADLTAQSLASQATRFVAIDDSLLL